MITRRTLLAGAGVLAGAQSKPRRNVLFVISDDLNTDVGCYGAAVRTPHLDRLAARGVRFERAYCQYPLCNPSRSSMLSGRRPESTRVFEQSTVLRQRDPGIAFLPDHFRANGYFVGGAGKVFHHAKPNVSGFSAFDNAETRSEGEEFASKRRYANPPGNRTPDWAQLDGPEDPMADTIAARKVCSWMEQFARESKPFFLIAGLRKPHLPWAVPKRYFDLYGRVTIDREPPLRDIPQIALVTELGASKPPASRAEAVAAYRAATSYMDAQIGTMLDALDSLKLRDSTVVVMAGDNGFHLGDHGLWSKHTLFERATQVPLIFAGPGIAQGVSPRTTELLDVYPTLAELTGVPAPAGLEGKSLAPLLRHPDAAWTRPARSVVQRENAFGRAVRTERWRYVEWDGGKQGRELYDHASDPGEFVNLAARADHAATVRELKKLL